MNFCGGRKQKVLAGGKVTREEALELVSVPLEALSQAADELREHFCGDRFDLCTIVNGKCGKCSEDCKYCAQSAHYHTSLEEELSASLSTEEGLVKGAAENKRKGVLRYSIVTSGRKLSDQEVDQAMRASGRSGSRWVLKYVFPSACWGGGLSKAEGGRGLPGPL